MFDEILSFLGLVGSGFIFALGFRGCDAFLSLIGSFIEKAVRRKTAD